MQHKNEPNKRGRLKRCTGGPYDGRCLPMAFGEGGTAVFRVGQWHGRYNEAGRWIPVKGTAPQEFF